MTPVAPQDEDGTVLVPVVKVNGATLSQDHLNELLELRVQAAVRTIGRCTLRFADGGYEIAKAKKFTVGSPVVVEAKGAARGSRQVPVFTGAITSVGLEQREGRGVELVVVAEDVAYELSRNSKAEAYLDQTYSAIITTILTARSAKPVVESTAAKQSYVLQTDTDLGFIDEIARRLGWDWVVDHTGSFNLWASWSTSGRTGTIGSPVTLKAGESLIEFSLKVTADAPNKVDVRGWDHLDKMAVVGTAQGNHNAVPAQLRSMAGLSDARPATLLDAQAGPVNPSEAKAMADVRARGTGTVLVRGRCWSTPELRPGVMVDLQEIGPASGEYFVQEVSHVLRRDGFRTEFVAGDREPRGLADGGMAGDGTADRSSFAHAGLVVGTVTDLNDPDNLGRVKVAYSGLSDSVTSDWARVATTGAGATRGAVFMPVVGDEVLVGFEGGDARRAVVLGGLFGKKDKVPAGSVVDGKVENRRITSQLGHVIELGDSTDPKKQHILLRLKDVAHRLRLGKDAAIFEVPANVPLTIAAGSSTIEMDGKGGLVLDASTITLKAKQGVTIEGLEIVAKASTKFAASGSTLELKGQASAALEAAGSTTIKGGMVQIN